MTWDSFINIAIVVMVGISILMVVTGCTPLIEVNMVQRATLDKGDGAIEQSEKIHKEDNDKLELIVPIK